MNKVYLACCALFVVGCASSSDTSPRGGGDETANAAQDVVSDTPSKAASDAQGVGDVLASAESSGSDAHLSDTLAAYDDLPPASDQWLLKTDAIPWSQLTNGVLQSSAVTMSVCTDHFPIGSLARAEVVEAASWFSGEANVAVKLTAAPHRPTSVMYADDASSLVPTLDYVTEGYPCHKVLACSDKYEDGKKVADGFALNVCKCRVNGCFGGSGKVVGFNVAVNSLCKGHFKDPSAGDYPRAENLAHELGHGFGMIHTPSWPLAHRGLVSTMQGNLHGLGAVDWALLRHHYGGPQLGEPKLTASPLARVAKDPLNLSDGFHRVAFSSQWRGASKKLAVNPAELYQAQGNYLDCDTQATPVFTMTWFNLGGACSNEMVHSLSVASPKAAQEEATLIAWRGVPMPTLAQDSWRGEVPLPAAKLEGLPHGSPLKTRLTLDVTRVCSSSSPDLVAIEGSITLHDSYAGCPK